MNKDTLIAALEALLILGSDKLAERGYNLAIKHAIDIIKAQPDTEQQVTADRMLEKHSEVLKALAKEDGGQQFNPTPERLREIAEQNAEWLDENKRLREALVRIGNGIHWEQFDTAQIKAIIDEALAGGETCGS